MLEYITAHPREAGVLLVILSGLVLLLFGLLASTDRAVSYQLGVKIEIDQMAAGKKRAFQAVGASLLVAGLLMLFFLLDSAGAPEPSTAPPVPAVSDTPSPTSAPATVAAGRGFRIGLADGEVVAQHQLVTGSYAPASRDDIWLFVRPSNGLYYPQSADPCAGAPALKANGLWEAPAVFGEAGDAGKPFDLLAVNADGPTSQSITDTLSTWCRAQNYPGMEALPSGASVAGSVRVTRGAEVAAAPRGISTASLPGAVTISGLVDGDTVPETLVVGGTVADDAAGSVWVLVYPYNAGRWYPQSTDACAGTHTVSEGGAWTVTAWFGSGPGAEYAVIAVLADVAADAELSALQKHWCAAGEYPGLRTIELPRGLEEKARVLVRGR